MRLLDTLSGEKREVPRGKRVNLFVCGPTVYDHAHIGHARTYLTFDMLVRYLRAEGNRVFYLQNITDIDDKIIDRAREEKRPALALATAFYREHRRDMRVLNIKSVTKYARATSFISDMMRQVRILMKKGFAYTIPGDGVYFDISKFPDYGKLSRRTALEAEDAVSRIDESVAKRNRGDFCLWKFSKPDEPSWDTNLGRGRPGWHIEDTAISEHHFGPQYDMHGGALDLKFPHHEAEIAQQEAASGLKPFVKIWLHAGFLYVDGKKMSKSLKNFISISEFLKNNKPDALRWIVFSHHYRSPIYYDSDFLDQHNRSWGGIVDFLRKLKFVEKAGGRISPASLSPKKLLEKFEAEARSTLDDDFNTPGAVAAFFGVVNAIQPHMWTLRRKDAKILRRHLTKWLRIFGFSPEITAIPLRVRILAWRRELSRRNEQFVQADALRKKIEELGYGVEDTPLGQFIQRGGNDIGVSRKP